MKRLLFVVAVLIAPTSAAYAQGPSAVPGSTLNGDQLGAGVGVTGPGSTAAADAGSTPLVGFVAYRVVPERASPGSLEGWCAVPNNPLGGAEYHIVGTAVDGRVVNDYRVCVPIVTAGVVPPPPLPQPPTVAEAWRGARLSHPTILTDPASRGITGLDTRIWATGRTTKSIGARVRGYAIVGTATLDHYTISVDGGPPQDAGSGHYVFETKGKHTIVIGAVWHGTATLTGPGLTAPITLADIGTATLTTTRIYPVNEIRSVLQP